MAESHVFALPPGVDFPQELVRGLIAQMASEPPEEMARLQLYLNSGRMMRRVREAFDAHGARFLPRLGLVSDLARGFAGSFGPVVPALRRRLELAQLVEQLTRRLPAFEAGAGVFSLADSLAQLMAEMQTEGVAPETFERLDVQESHAEHWRRSLEFLRIVARFFEDEGALDPAARQRRAAEMLTEAWAVSPATERIVVAGSTGSRGATALFMQAVARLPRGMIVLPGFDFDLPEQGWKSLYSREIPIEDHPQFRFLRLLDDLQLAPGAVRPWTETLPPSPARNAVVSLALRPAPVTDQWMREGQSLGDLPAACAGLALIEAADPRAEATAIALALREAAEEGRSAALITPDRMLTRRVAAMLDRWGIMPDDSAGEPLQQTPPGRLLRHVAQQMGRKLTIEGLLVLLKHPLTATGGEIRGDHLRFTRDLELHLRRRGPAYPDAEALARWAARAEDRGPWAVWLGALIARFTLPPAQSLSAWIETHSGLADTLAAGPVGRAAESALWRSEAGQACVRLFEDLRAEAPYGGEVTAANYADLIDSLMGEVQIRDTTLAHPGVAILGTLEARVQAADLTILAGLNEGSWPEAPAPDPWLSRRMRLDVGLLLPERQIGLSAHDFQQAIAGSAVILSRARRDADAETVPSRWINRLTNLLDGLPAQGGDAALAQMRGRGARYLALAAAMDRPVQSVPAAPRPAPRPPAEARPRQLSVTAIRTLIRDPYAIYARHILRLNPLDPLRPEPDPRLRGEVLHRIVELFVKGWLPGEAPADAQLRLMAIAETVLADEIPWPSAQRMWLARIGRIAGKLAEDETARRMIGTPVVVEKKGSITLQETGFTLTAKPDRIDILADGSAHLYDYKTGEPPSDAQVKHFDKQLLLEAAMIARGAFGDIGPRSVAAMTYLRLGGTGESRDLAMGLAEIDETWARFGRLIARYLTPGQGYTARRALQSTHDQSDYDHLSRFGEWELSDDVQPEDVG